MHLEIFPRTVAFDGLGLCFSVGGCCCPRAEFYSLNGTSTMESVVLRSWGLLSSGAMLHCVDQAGLDLTEKSTCLCSARIKGVYYHTWHALMCSFFFFFFQFHFSLLSKNSIYT